MGGSSSTEQISPEQKEVESLAASTGALPILQKAFSKLADPETNSIPLKSLQECFSLNLTNPSETSSMPECFPRLLSHLGLSIVDLFFVSDKGGVNWFEFLRGYVKCCGRMSVSMSLNTFYRLYAATSAKAGIPSKLIFESDDPDCKVSGSVTATDVRMSLWICWIMSQSSRILKISQVQAQIDIPDTDHLMLSALTSCSENGGDLNVWDCNISSLEVEFSAQKLHMWVLSTVPQLANCFTQYVRARLQRCATLEGNSQPFSLSISGVSMAELRNNRNLLTCGRAWAISLTLRSTLSEELQSTCIPGDSNEKSDNLLYWSSIHGKGLNRFWSNVEGYHGPCLILISANSEDTHDNGSNLRRWVIGVLTDQGFENKEVFYGSSGYLYAISPVFRFFAPHGKDKNFVYSHLHPSARAYEPNPKPVGIAFGGTMGNERIFIDEDFAKVTIRHHASDKTYQPGPLTPNQGFLPLEASVLDVEVWGFGGEIAKKDQNAYKNREQLFTEQRRKVDLKTFANWEDSPEKMMMDMVSDPNAVRREER